MGGRKKKLQKYTHKNIEMTDVYTGSKVMKEKNEEKYLGDIISVDGKNTKIFKQDKTREGGK